MPTILSLLAGCSGRINGNLQQDGSAGLALEMSLEPRMTALLRSLSSLGSAARSPEERAVPPDRNVPVINGPAIARSLAAAPGIRSAELANTGPTGIAGTIRVSRVDESFAMPGAAKRFVTLEEEETGDRRLLVVLDREIAPLLLGMISADIRDYLSALFAPAATGDTLSKAEYLELVEDIYGKALAEEIAAATIAVTIGFPGAIRSVKGGTFTGASAVFTMALADFLVLEDPLEYEVVWR